MLLTPPGQRPAPVADTIARSAAAVGEAPSDRVWIALEAAGEGGA